MTNPDQPTVGDLTARLEFRYENDPLDFLKTGKGYLVVDDKVATIPLPTGEKGEKGETGRLAEGDVRYFNHRTDEAVKAAEEASESAESAKQDEVTTRGHREHIDAQRQHVDAQKQSVDESAEKADADEKSAKASAEQAATDRAQTGADRTQTGLDRQAAQQAREHIDAQRQHFDSHIEHIDSQSEHVDAQAEHVDEQAGIATTKAEEASVSATSAQEAADRLGSAEMIEGWVASAEASADTASDAADEATSAVRAEVEKLTAGAPEAFDTLKEISDELEKNETERAALATTIGKKADKGHKHAISDTSGLQAALDGKAGAGHKHDWADITGTPPTDLGYDKMHAEDSYSEYPVGFSYAMSNAMSHGWNETIRKDVPDAPTDGFVTIQTMRHLDYEGSTVQHVYSYNNTHRPIYVRKWYNSESGWGPFRSLTDDGHTHSVGEIRGADEALGKKADTSYVDSAVSDKAAKSEVGKKADTSYVDEEISKQNLALGQTKLQIMGRPALFHGYGPPRTIAGAGLGDKYLDLDKMEIYILGGANIG